MRTLAIYQASIPLPRFAPWRAPLGTAALVLVLSTLCVAAAAHAGDTYSARSSKDSKDSKAVIQKPVPETRFYLSLSAGGNFDEYHVTRFLTNGGGNVDVPTTAGLGIVGLPFKSQVRTFNALHDPATINGNLDAGYKINDTLSVFVGFTYDHGDGGQHSAGRVTDTLGLFGPANGIYRLEAHASDYEAYAGRAGLKVTTPRTLLDLVHIPHAIKPYFIASVGGKYLEEQHVDFTAGGFLNQRGNLYDSGWVLTSQAAFGYEIEPIRNLSIFVESGYGYDTKPEHDGPVLTGVTGVNKGGDRFYNAVKLGASLKF